MRTINTRQDVEDLLRDGGAPEVLSKHLAEFFHQLEAELANDEEDTFHLNQHGSIILLEAGDNLHSLELADLSSNDLCYAIEFVETLDLGDVQAYRIAAMLDNDFVVTVFTLAGTHNEEEEAWLKELAERN